MQCCDNIPLLINVPQPPLLIANADDVDDSQIGDILYTTGNTTLSFVKMDVFEAESSTSLLSYQSASPSEHRLLIRNSSLYCPLTFSIELINSTAYGSKDGIETMNVSQGRSRVAGA